MFIVFLFSLLSYLSLFVSLIFFLYLLNTPITSYIIFNLRNIHTHTYKERQISNYIFKIYVKVKESEKIK